MDSVDKVIWVLPLLAVLDIVSTFYAESLGYDLRRYEVGLFASFFVQAGLVYVYVVVYLVGIMALSYGLWYVKSKLDSSQTVNKVAFLFLVGLACFVYIRLTAAFTVNFLLPYLDRGTINLLAVNLLIYLGTIFTLVIYLSHDVVMWVKSNGREQTQ